ncbi:TPA: hypothetical protein H1016_05505 [archaeon]|uniref:Uncharacterized protein n=1 Tax=Candidatus Naiadarchaeum limnaeum TaxID=2756139 RepID=A0A832UPD3_9ARCH|nr:hypothetical protein [Candidatus Naiadarchaeum limnaeum]
MASKILVSVVIILFLIIAYFVWRDFIQPNLNEKTRGTPQQPKSAEENKTTGTGINDVFEEPPQDFEPPSLPT